MVCIKRFEIMMYLALMKILTVDFFVFENWPVHTTVHINQNNKIIERLVLDKADRWRTANLFA